MSLETNYQLRIKVLDDQGSELQEEIKELALAAKQNVKVTT